jgi:hypothetical protein
MKAEEKAEALIKKMLSKSPNIQDGVSIIDAIQAKQCAIIAVDEIIESLFSNDEHITLKRKFFLEVKQELEKLCVN